MISSSSRIGDDFESDIDASMKTRSLRCNEHERGWQRDCNKDSQRRSPDAASQFEMLSGRYTYKRFDRMPPAASPAS